MCREVVHAYACTMGQKCDDNCSPDACETACDGADFTGEKCWQAHYAVSDGVLFASLFRSSSEVENSS